MHLVCSVCELDVEESEIGRICRFITKKSCAGSLIFQCINGRSLAPKGGI